MATLSATVSAHVADAFAGAWKRLDQDVSKADGLDAVRRAHRAYLDAIASDALFAPRSGIPEEGVPPDEDLAAGALATHLEAVLQAAQRFCALGGCVRRRRRRGRFSSGYAGGAARRLDGPLPGGRAAVYASLEAGVGGRARGDEIGFSP